MAISMRWLAACLFGVIPFPAVIADTDIDDVPINTAQELVDWCKHEVEQRHLGHDKIPGNWRIRHLVKGNYYYVRLTYRIDYEDQYAVCQVRKGAQRRYAVYQDNAELDEVRE